ncbi:hypothetical protein MIR68_009508 [Amoeboaphelidium protococcarum]|nr:hypothetical protein MIR68_009508 [Amoeboaphelidium protococcarum]
MKAIVLISDGSEEMEAVIAIDVLRRAQIQVDVVIVTTSRTVVCSRQVKIEADSCLSELQNVDSYDALILPGGLAGAKFFCSDAQVQSLLKRYVNAPQKVIGIICASPIALVESGLCKGCKITSHPSVKSQLDHDYEYVDDERVVTATINEGGSKLITSRGPGTSFDFALSVVKELAGESTVEQVKAPMML